MLKIATIQNWVTGKFVMEIQEKIDKNKNPRLAIAVQLALNINIALPVKSSLKFLDVTKGYN